MPRVGSVKWTTSVGASVFAGLSLSAQPPNLLRDTAGASDTDGATLTSSATAAPHGNAASPSEGSMTRHAYQQPDRADGQDCCSRKRTTSLLAVADSRATLHLLCPQCGTATRADAAALKIGLPQTPGHGFLADPVGGLGADVALVDGVDAMSSVPCWVRDVVGAHREETSATHGFDPAERFLAWCTNSGVVGLSSVGCCEMVTSLPEHVMQPAPGLNAAGTLATRDIGLTMSPEKLRQDLTEPKYGPFETPSVQEAVALRGVLSSNRAAWLAEVGCCRTVQMPAATFSAPVAFGQCILLGCRDDYMYCLTWQ